MSGNTPGPWVADLDAQWGPYVYGDDAIVADYSMWDGHREEARANARLIAAAPDLLEALTDLLGYGCPACNGDCGGANPPVPSCPTRTAAAAIAKATGDAP